MAEVSSQDEMWKTKGCDSCSFNALDVRCQSVEKQSLKDSGMKPAFINVA